jgi:hypothetical protein
MKIYLLGAYGGDAALMGLGLSYGLTTPHDYWDDVPEETKQRLYKIAEKLCVRDGGENKFLRQLMYYWSVEGPRFWWCEADTYKVATVAQSASTMHTIMHRSLSQNDFEYGISPSHLEYLNGLIAEYKDKKDEKLFLRLKNDLPEGFLQRRIWSLSLANMKNIYAQRKSHRLPQWHQVCQVFVEETPVWLRGIYG